MPTQQGTTHAQAEQLKLSCCVLQADLEAKEAIEPPKLGRHKFVPLPVQVMASDDVSGSLRKLKTTPVVVKDRFKSFQKRGIIQVRHWFRPLRYAVLHPEVGNVD